MKTSTDELLVFVTVIDSGSITAAAEKLGQTVSGVSRALKRVERGRLAVVGSPCSARYAGLASTRSLLSPSARACSVESCSVQCFLDFIAARVKL
ncbi:coenzyme F420-reducing hydrogenase beta subunit [Paraburkholderia sp. UCT70]